MSTALQLVIAALAAATKSKAKGKNKGRIPSARAADTMVSLGYLSQAWTHLLSPSQRQSFRDTNTLLRASGQGSANGKNLFVALSSCRRSMNMGILTQCPPFPEPIIPLPTPLVLSATTGEGGFSLQIQSPAASGSPAQVWATGLQSPGRDAIRKGDMKLLGTITLAEGANSLTALYLARYFALPPTGWVGVNLIPVTECGFRGPITPLRASVTAV